MGRPPRYQYPGIHLMRAHCSWLATHPMASCVPTSHRSQLRSCFGFSSSDSHPIPNRVPCCPHAPASPQLEIAVQQPSLRDCYTYTGPQLRSRFPDTLSASLRHDCRHDRHRSAETEVARQVLTSSMAQTLQTDTENEPVLCFRTMKRRETGDLSGLGGRRGDSGQKENRRKWP